MGFERRNNEAQCSYWCVNCPFKVCVFDGKKRFDIQERNKEIFKLSKSKTAKELSEMFGLSISTINKVKKEG